MYLAVVLKEVSGTHCSTRGFVLLKCPVMSLLLSGGVIDPAERSSNAMCITFRTPTSGILNL